MDFLRSIELWVAVQIAIDLCLIFLFLLAIKQFRVFRQKYNTVGVEDVQNIIQPVLEEARLLARQFETQLKEKQDIVRNLNDCLDDRIIGLNLLLNRAETRLADGGLSQGDSFHSGDDVDRLQREVITLAEKGMSSKNIAESLGIGKGEVDLVLDLKRKFGQTAQA
jgi:hypothetical protein